MGVFGYKPTASRSRLMCSDEPPVEEDSDELDEVLRIFIKEALAEVHFGFRRGSLDDVKKSFPVLFSFLQKNYGDFLGGCVVALRGNDRLRTPAPYVLLPDKRLTVITWDDASSRPVYSQSEDVARSIERLK